MDYKDTKDFKQYPEKVKDLYTLFKVNNKYPKILGSASLRNQQYYGDFDFYLYIGNINKSDLYDIIKSKLNAIIDNYNYYFIELKVQTKNNGKFRWNYGDDFLKDDFMKIDDIDFVKIDLVVFLESTFVEVSIIYQIGKSKFSDNFFIKKLKNDIVELKKDGMYYKILKRIYSINRIKKNNKILSDLTDFFNSNIGKQYSIYSNIGAILLADKYYSKDKDYIKRRKINTKLLKIPSTQLENYYNEIFNEINLNAKQKIDELGIKI